MKTTALIGLILILFSFTSQAQRKYSKQNLQQATPEDLGLYYIKAKKQKKTGEYLSIVGTASGLVGIILGSVTENQSGDGSFVTIVAQTMLVGGSVALTIGATMFIIALSRIERINDTISRKNKVYLEFAPCSFNNYMAQNHQVGITFRVRF